MMPVAASVSKKPSSFTIDSLMGKSKEHDSRESSPVRDRSPSPSPREARTIRSPRDSSPDRPLPAHTGSSGFQPVVPGMGAAAAAFLHGINASKGHSGHFDPHPSDLPMHLTAESLHNLHPGLGTVASGHMGFPNPLQCGTGGMPLGLANSAAHQLGMHQLLLGHHRESLGPYFPWFLSRHGNLLSHRFAGPDASLLLQPFRKPKRIRTAFSPSQLLRLEHAFEKNHYVVGQERKDLAVNLSLTETQVKVWFQNRRTKYKRMKAEDEEKGGSQDGGGSGKTMEHGETGHSSPLSPASEEDLILDSSDDDSQSLHGPPSSTGHSEGSPGTAQHRSKTSHHINRWRVETNQV